MSNPVNFTGAYHGLGNVVRLDETTANPVTVTPGTLGQQTMAASAPVVLASDQSAVPVTLPATSIYRDLDAGATGAIVKNAAGQLRGLYVYNSTGATRYLKIYNKATAPTSGDTPVLTLGIPASSAGPGGAAVRLPELSFSAGISIRATTGVADNDTGATSSNDVVVNLFYA